MVATVDMRDEVQRQVVIIVTDMAQYSFKTATLSPIQIRDFLIQYHGDIHDIVDIAESHPLDIESLAGDGNLIVFDGYPGEAVSQMCNRAIAVAIRISRAIEQGCLPETRMGILLGDIIEARIGNKRSKFSARFSVANRLEELCGYFGCHFLMGRDVAKEQTLYDDYLVTIGKVSLSSIYHPMNIYTLYKGGVQNWPLDLSDEDLFTFIKLKNDAMELFSGNSLVGILPDFPLVRERLLDAQKFYIEKVGVEDRAIAQILKYISEKPKPNSDFNTHGMKMLEKKRDALGERILHMSCGFLRALDADLYNTLIEDTGWEVSFKLEWREKDDIIVKIGDLADGVYYIDSGAVRVLNVDGKVLAILGEGSVFGEVAYLHGEMKRTATVVADTNVVLRKISTADLNKYPSIKNIFEKIAQKKKKTFYED